ncbi:hypothetical protein TWF506_010769 [Arthrobotrys conoides]|uniref:Uncharacterized protein n=1 Tax=Arthrobotrys conoides TaxID=74498 RepID=A0AAN8N9C2_9PEZI
MVQLSIPIAAIVLPIFIQQASAHARFYWPFGDIDLKNTPAGQHPGAGYGGVIGHYDDIAIKNHGHHQHPGQWDVTVFSDPIIPATWQSPFKHIPRKYMANGCGTTLSNIFHYNDIHRKNEITPPNLHGSPLMWDHRNYHFFMAPIPNGVGARNSPAIWLADIFKRGTKIPQCSPGGTLTIRSNQVNDDGAGPFRCRLNEDGTGNTFGPWLTITQQPPSGHNSINYASNSQAHFLTVKLPPNTKCAGVNGPFGGCTAFQVQYPEPKIVPPPPPKPVVVDRTKPEPKPDYGYAGYDVGNNNYKEGAYGKKIKRGISEKMRSKKARRAAVQAGKLSE